MSNPTDNAAMTLPLSDLRDRIKELLAKATPGPWTNGMRGEGPSGDAHMCQIVSRREASKDGTKWAHGIGVARTWHPDALVSYVGLSRQECVDNAELICLLRNHADLFLSLLGGAAPLQTQWRTIETAPKDGTRVMLYGCEFHRHWFGTGYYFKGVPGDGEGWVAFSFYTLPNNDSSGSFTPTHWMPLLSPPEAK